MPEPIKLLTVQEYNRVVDPLKSGGIGEVKEDIIKLKEDIIKVKENINDIKSKDWELMWENANIEGDFVDQYIPIDYPADFYAIVTSDGNSNGITYLMSGGAALMFGFDGSNARKPIWRHVECDSENIHFSSARGFNTYEETQGTIKDSLLKPVKIYKIRT